MHRQFQSIVALASAPGAGAVAVIRASGPEAIAIATRHLRRKGAGPWRERRMHYCDFIGEPAPGVAAETIDDVMAVSYPPGSSYTGEGSVEIFCHGSPFVVGRILAALQSSGLRLAEPGEFTRRAFLNGRIDLTQAEGINALITAVTREQWQAGRLLGDAKLGRLASELREGLVKAMAFLEAGIDFPDEGDTQGLDLRPVLQYVDEVEARLQRLLATYDTGHVMADGLRVMLCGVPNAGKSTLLNALLRKERALVSPVAGTTRDYIQEACLIKGRLVQLIDTAGIRRTDDLIERQGIEKALALSQEADVIVLLYPADMSLAEKSEFDGMVAAFNQTRTLPILTKADLGVPEWAAGFVTVAAGSQTPQAGKAGESSGQLLEAFEDKLLEIFAQRTELFSSSDAVLVNLRQKACVEETLRHIQDFRAAANEGQFEECLAFNLQSAARSLTDIVGVIESEQVLDALFSAFCVGK